jgi:ATP/maltotriose-dependent transcriptional regulator MalT
LTAYFLVSERLQQAEVTANRAVALGRRTRQPFALVTAASWLGTTKFFLGEFDDAQRLLLESLSGYDVDAHGRNARAGLDPAVLASSHLSWLRWLRGDVEAARRQEAETRVIADALDTPVARAHALNYAAGLAVLLGDADEALRIAEQEHEIASEFGLPHYVAYAEILAASARRDRDPAEAADALRAGLDKRGQTGARLAGTFHYALLADLELAAGRVTVAAAELATGRRVVADTAERWWLPEIERLEGEVHRSRGRAHDARECFERAHRTAIAMGAPMLATRALLSGAHLALDLHDVRRASKLVAAIEVPVAPTLPEARALEQIHAELSR